MMLPQSIYCGKSFHYYSSLLDTMVLTVCRPDRLCPECRMESSVKCDVCKKITPISSSKKVIDEYFCKECYIDFKLETTGYAQ